MSWVRRFWRLPALFAVLLIGLFILIVLFPRWNATQRQNMIRRWSNWIMGILNVEVFAVTAGAQTLNTLPAPYLLAANHISWLDIFVVDSIWPVSFVAKSDIKQWPLIGKLCDLAGTIFVERTRRHAVRQVLDDMGAKLTAGFCVGVFPEGTTGNQKEVLPFHANLLEAAVRTQTPIVPVALAYVREDGQDDPNALFVEPINFVDSVLTITGAPGMRVKLVVCETVILTQEQTRHDAAHLCYERINAALGKLIDKSGPSPATLDA